MSLQKKNEEVDRTSSALPYMHKRINSITKTTHPHTYMLSEYAYESPEYNQTLNQLMQNEEKTRMSQMRMKSQIQSNLYDWS